MRDELIRRLYNPMTAAAYTFAFYADTVLGHDDLPHFFEPEDELFVGADLFADEDDS